MPPFQRAPYIDMFIKDIRVTDFRVAVSGIVVDVGEQSFVLDDSTGHILVFGSDFEHVKLGAVIRVLGTVSPGEDGVVITADLFQDWSALDPILLKKVKDALFDEKPL